MARVVIYREWPDGDKIQITVEVDASYPDALAEAKATLIKSYAEVLDVTMAADAQVNPDES